MNHLHLPTFFSYARRAPFGGRLSQSQVDGMKDLFEAWEELGDGDDRKLAYCLATNFHETGGKMQPVREGFAKTDKQARFVVRHRRYGKPAGSYNHVYYGRGDVQLTWEHNYDVMGKLLGINLVKNPDLALESKTSKRILVEGMMQGRSGKGDFTGRALEHYFTSEKADPVGARKIVNGTDKDELIASYYEHFLASLDAANEAKIGVKTPEAGEPRRFNPLKDLTSVGTAITGISAAVGGVLDRLEGVDNIYTLAAYAAGAAGLYLVLSGRLRLNYLTGA